MTLTIAQCFNDVLCRHSNCSSVCGEYHSRGDSVPRDESKMQTDGQTTEAVCKMSTGSLLPSEV